MFPLFTRRFLAVLVLSLIAAPALLLAESSARFAFRVPETGNTDALAREIEATVILPSGEKRRFPAFLLGPGRDVFSVRVRGEQLGAYRLDSVSELSNGESRRIEFAAETPAEVRVTSLARPHVVVDPRDSRQLALSNGASYFPLGSNLPWAEGGEEPAPYFRRVFADYAKAGQNWTRIWMCSWSFLNLDWLPDALKSSPKPGDIDLRVAANWDAIIDAAEENGLYLQMVFQHHGQLSTAWDTNWATHPWNAANPGGFLKGPNDFFTDNRALELTRRKYRYIVARWGYSSSILAWELFNEPHNTDAYRASPSMEPQIAAWHRSMAAHLRAIDPYHHLITTSAVDVRSPMYDHMDLYQPHLYSSNVFAAVRRFDVEPELLEKPVFWGEFGDDQSFHPKELVDTNAVIPSLMWASLMGSGRYPAAPWTGDLLLRKQRLPEMQALARFVQETGLAERRGLQPFSPAVESATRIPLRIEAGHWWQRIPAATLRFPTDGSEPSELYLIPRAFTGSPNSVEYGYPDRVTLKINYPKQATAKLRVNKVGRYGARIRVQLDGVMVAAQIWPALPEGAPDEARAWEASFPVDKGEHTLLIENPGGPDWFELRDVDTGLDRPAIAAVGKRSGDFLVLWAYNLPGMTSEVAPAEAVLLLDKVPAGDWTLTWWDSVTGTAGRTTQVRHPGGLLRVPTPPIAKHAALILKRSP